MSTEYMKTTTDAQREALARKIARLRLEGAPWDGPGGIVDSMRLVSSATQGRALLRKYKLDAKAGGPVEILQRGAQRLCARPTGGDRDLSPERSRLAKWGNEP